MLLGLQLNIHCLVVSNLPTGVQMVAVGAQKRLPAKNSDAFPTAIGEREMSIW